MQIRNRIKKQTKAKASELQPHPLNWRTHGDEQRKALRAIFGEIGFAGVTLVYKSERNGGALTIIDGHLRQDEVGPDFELPIAITDLNDAEADKLLALLHHVGDMAEADPAKLAELVAVLETDSDEVDALLASLTEERELAEAGGDVKLKKVSEQPPPAMSWVLVGIPTVRFGEIAGIVEQLAAVPDSFVESTVSNG
jgi:hypothetical protein